MRRTYGDEIARVVKHKEHSANEGTDKELQNDLCYFSKSQDVFKRSS